MVIEYEKYIDTFYINGMVRIKYSLEELGDCVNYDIFLEALEREELEYAIYPALNHLTVTIEVRTEEDLTKLLKILVGETNGIIYMPYFNSDIHC